MEQVDGGREREAARPSELEPETSPFLTLVGDAHHVPDGRIVRLDGSFPVDDA
jgi:hypothetical protein